MQFYLPLVKFGKFCLFRWIRKIELTEKVVSRFHTNHVPRDGSPEWFSMVTKACFIWLFVTFVIFLLPGFLLITVSIQFNNNVIILVMNLKIHVHIKK